MLGGIELFVSAVRLAGFEAIRPVFGLAVGIVALATLSEMKSEVVQLILIVLGLISGNAGGFLIALAGIIGLVARYAYGTAAQQATPAATTAT